MNNPNEHSTSRETYDAEFRSPDGYRKLYNLNKLILNVGSHSDADIAYPGLLFNHAEIRYENNAWTIRKSNPAAVLEFNNCSFDMKKLNPGDHINLGSGVLIFRGHNKDSSSTELIHSANRKPVFTLKIRNGKEKGRIIDLYPGEYILGRKEPSESATSENRIEFDNHFVSRSHARLYVEQNRVLIEDLNSTNGIRINRRHQTTGELGHNDCLGLGKLKLDVMDSGNDKTSTKIISLQYIKLKRMIFWFTILAIGAIAILLGTLIP